jgi:hypothetical protein
MPILIHYFLTETQNFKKFIEKKYAAWTFLVLINLFCNSPNKIKKIQYDQSGIVGVKTLLLEVKLIWNAQQTTIEFFFFLN